MQQTKAFAGIQDEFKNSSAAKQALWEREAMKSVPKALKKMGLTLVGLESRDRFECNSRPVSFSYSFDECGNSGWVREAYIRLSDGRVCELSIVIYYRVGIRDVHVTGNASCYKNKLPADALSFEAMNLKTINTFDHYYDLSPRFGLRD